MICTRNSERDSDKAAWIGWGGCGMGLFVLLSRAACTLPFSCVHRTAVTLCADPSLEMCPLHTVVLGTTSSARSLKSGTTTYYPCDPPASTPALGVHLSRGQPSHYCPCPDLCLSPSKLLAFSMAALFGFFSLLYLNGSSGEAGGPVMNKELWKAGILTRTHRSKMLLWASAAS